MAPPSRTEKGAQAEALAASELRRRGLRIVCANWRCRAGEIDLVARDGVTWCFVEVRSRSQARYGSPPLSIDHRKRARLIAAARWYLREHRLEQARIRFDCVAVTPDGVQVVQGAFVEEGGR